MIAPGRHNTGWPRFTLAQWTRGSDQSHRLHARVEGRIDSHDARGPEWEVVRHRPLEQSGVKLKVPKRQP